jgi:hypothetical protein
VDWYTHLQLSARNDSRFYAYIVKCCKIIRWVVLTVSAVSIPVGEWIYHFVQSNPLLNWSSDDDPRQYVKIEPDELEGTFGKERGGREFLNRFSIEALTRWISESPLGQKLRESGFPEWTIELDLSDPFNHYFFLRSPKFRQKDQYLIYLVVRTDQCTMRVASHSARGLAFLRENVSFDSWNLFYIRWLSLQNPGRRFTPDRPRLPGQMYPGSGLGRVFLAQLRRYCIEEGVDGIMNVPEHFHNAVMYKGFCFLDPYHQGQFNRMLLDLDGEIRHRSLAQVSWAVGSGALRLDGANFKWNMGEHIYPLSARAISYFNSCHYTDTVVEQEIALGKYTIDWDAVGRII